MSHDSAAALADRVVLVIGGTTGLGLAGACACARAGARVVVVGRNEQNVERARAELGESGRALAADATDPHTASRAIELAVSSFGRLDALYHVAGGSGRSFGDGPLHEITETGWQRTMELNLSSVFHSNRAAIGRFLETDTSGSILNMTSVLASSPEPRHFATHAYAAAKTAIVGMTRSAAAYYAPKNIRINAIAPALVETPMAKRACESDEIRRFVESKQPLDGGRVGVPADLDAAVVFLLSDAARFVTGQVLAVDGGWSVS